MGDSESLGVLVRKFGNLCLIVLTCGVGCSQNFERGKADSPPRSAMAKTGGSGKNISPRNRSPRAMTPMGQRRSEGGQGSVGLAASSSEASVSGIITVSPQLADRIPSHAVIFLMARERKQGGPPPYAVQRLHIHNFPHRYSLGQPDVLPMFGEGLVFADIDEMYIVVRIDQDGLAGPPMKGDMDGVFKDLVKPGQKDVNVVIDKLY